MFFSSFLFRNLSNNTLSGVIPESICRLLIHSIFPTNGVFACPLPSCCVGSTSCSIDQKTIASCSNTTKCSDYSSSAKCASQACQWCLKSNSCVSLTSSCLSHITNPQYCPLILCSELSTCQSCTTTSAQTPCTWCLETQGCVNNTSTCGNTISNRNFCPHTADIVY